RDRVDAGARDGERDRVEPATGVRIQDRRAQRSGARVVGVRDREGGGGQRESGEPVENEGGDAGRVKGGQGKPPCPGQSIPFRGLERSYGGIPGPDPCIIPGSMSRRPDGPSQRDRAEALQEVLAERILVLDGATGTWLQGQDLTAQDFGGTE